MIISRADYFRADLAPVQTPPASQPRTFERFESNSYAEYGLSPRTTIGGKVIYGTSALTGPSANQAQSGFSEVEIFLQRRIYQSQHSVASIQFSSGLPSRFGSGVRDGLASDGVDLSLSALYGVTITHAPVKVFAAAQSGYRKRTGSAADQINSQLTVGAEPSDRWLFVADFFSTISVGNEDFGGANFDIWKIQPALVYHASTRWSIELGVNEEIAGRNVATGRTFFVGLWSRF